MFENDTNAAETVSRRNVLKTAGGFITGSTALAGLGVGRGAAETEEGLRFEVEEANEEIVTARMMLPHGVYSPRETFLGLADDFIVHEDEDAVSLPEDAEGLANPVEVERLGEDLYRMYFRTEDVGSSKVADFVGSNYIEMGLGVFLERTMPTAYYDEATMPGGSID